MSFSKEEIRRVYHISPEDFDVLTALALHPTCENCNKPLPPTSKEARICSFECTFCVECVETVLRNVCPNCGGGFMPRPIRPARNWRRGNFLGAFPACTSVTHRPVDPVAHLAFSRELRALAPERR